MIVRIKSSRDGYRRCGVAHPKATTDHPASRFTEDELARLQDDPVLTVELLDGELEEPADSDGDGSSSAGGSGSSEPDKPKAASKPKAVPKSKSSTKAKPKAEPEASANTAAKDAAQQGASDAPPTNEGEA
ncbi:hypothetical protein D9M68_303300 [compost metagenome]